ncbi:MAG: ABC transporter permease [Spirochaetia bacterium]|jgi:ribose transport system permease protein
MKATLPLMERARQMVRLRWSDFIFMGIFVVLILISSLISETFFTTRNLINISRQIVTNGLISLGMLIVMLTGGVDLSVGSIVAICGIMATGLQKQMPTPVAILVALMVGTTVGMANGFFIARFKLQPFIVTLATMGIIRGATYVYSETPQSPVDPLFRSLLGGGFVGPIPRSAIIMLAFFIVVWFFLNRTIPGRAVVAIGGNEEAVRLAGINVKGHLLMAYMVCGLFAGFAGVLLASRLGIAQPSFGLGFEMDALAAVVIGGGIMGGGGGGAIGTLWGVLILGVIDNLLNQYNVQSYYQQIIKGLIILAAVLSRRKK